MSSKLESIDLGIAEALETDLAFRSEYLRAWARSEVATQLRQMRQRRGLRQHDVAAKSGTKQSAISRIEKADYEGWTFKTLLKIAEVLDARLEISLTPIESVVSRFAEHEQQEAASHAVEPSDTGFVGTYSAGTIVPGGDFDDVNLAVPFAKGTINNSLVANVGYQGV